MTNNQEWFNNECPKDIKKIKLQYEDFEGDFVVEDYSDLEKLYLLDLKSINKLTLKNLTNLQDCTIRECDLKDLVIEDCPQIKKLNVRSNLLTSLKFLSSLTNLEEIGRAHV